MNQIKFAVKKSKLEDYPVVEIYIDNQNLIALLGRHELSYYRKNPRGPRPGNYEGLAPNLTLPPHKHFWGVPTEESYTHPDRRVAIYEHGQSGVPGEWTMTVQILVDGDGVTWQNFENVHYPDWDYEPIGPYRFDLNEYRDALRGVEVAWLKEVE